MNREGAGVEFDCCALLLAYLNYVLMISIFRFMRLDLIGCLHNDPNGEDRIQTILDDLKPNCVTLEYRGEEAAALQSSQAYQDALAKYHDLAREALTRFGFDPEAYTAANAIADTLFGEVRGTLAWVKRNGVTVVPTEDPTEQLAHDRRLIANPESVVHDFTDWLSSLADKGEVYNPYVYFSQSLDEYTLLKDHMLGRDDAVVADWIDRYREAGILTPARHAYQIHAIRSTLDSMEGGRLVHIGGAIQLVDAGILSPPSIFQAIRLAFPNIEVKRFSLG